MTKLHITTTVNFGYKPVDTGKNITDENTNLELCKDCHKSTGCNYCGNYHMENKCDGCPGNNIDVYLAGTVKAFPNYTGILMSNNKHITLHYGDVTTLPNGLFFNMPVIVKVVGVSTSKAGECLVVEVLIPGHETLTEQI